ncbi:MAG: hypothetical protein H6742_12250 [Alphaproteobacteria bacterium]|nr:hypothetical protein [Alphaproteobacteria bacterium]
MTSFLPSLADTLIDLVHYGDTGALRVTDEGREWVFHVQGGILVGVQRAPPLPEDLEGSELAARCMTEVMELKTPLFSFEEGSGPDSFGLFDVRHALGLAMGDTRSVDELLRALEPVLDAWPELRADADTLSPDVAVQRWLATMDGLAPGIDRIRSAPPPASRSMAALWVAWKLGDLDLHDDQLIDDEPEAVAVGNTTEEESPLAPEGTRSGAFGAVGGEPHADEVDGDEATAQTAHTALTAHTDVTALTQSFAEKLAKAVDKEPSSSIITAVLPDPFVAGVALARAGDAPRALALLEAAWEEDPERPGLEEWLGYTRFTALRESNPEAARQGLAMLRDVMYRTGGGAEQPTQPWVLMARAQFERGDLLQARSVLDTALDRESDDPEAMDLDARLKKAEAEAEALRQRRSRPSGVRIALLLIGVAILVAAAVVWQLTRPAIDPPRVNHARSYSQTVMLDELYLVDSDWFGVYPAEQTPEPDDAWNDCQALAEVTELAPSHSITLVSRSGVPLAECGTRFD